MNQPSPPPFGSLPPHVRNDPDVINWRLDDHGRRIGELEARPHLPKLDRVPWLQLAGLLILLGLGLFGHLSKGDMVRIGMRSLGL